MHPILNRQPTSQHRNKTIFSLITNHKSEFCFPAVWNYFEAGHGQGPCSRWDGKENGRGSSQNRQSENPRCCRLHDWGRKNEKSSSVSYRFYLKEEYPDAGKFLERKCKDVKAVPNTMKIHSVAGISVEQVNVKETPCYCDQC